MLSFDLALTYMPIIQNMNDYYALIYNYYIKIYLNLAEIKCRITEMVDTNLGLECNMVLYSVQPQSWKQIQLYFLILASFFFHLIAVALLSCSSLILISL